MSGYHIALEPRLLVPGVDLLSYNYVDRAFKSVCIFWQLSFLVLRPQGSPIAQHGSASTISSQAASGKRPAPNRANQRPRVIASPSPVGGWDLRSFACSRDFGLRLPLVGLSLDGSDLDGRHHHRHGWVRRTQ